MIYCLFNPNNGKRLMRYGKPVLLNNPSPSHVNRVLDIIESQTGVRYNAIPVVRRVQ